MSIVADETPMPAAAPLHDLDAEQSVLGSMLLSTDAIAAVLDGPMQVRDYSRPAHEVIHRAIVDLYARGEPVDPITVAAELTRRGDLARAGGPAYLHTLVHETPSAASADHYAALVHERAVRRRLDAAGVRIQAMARSGQGEFEEIASAAEAELLEALRGREEAAGYAPVSSDLPGFWDRLEARMRGEGGLTGLPTGITDLDALTHGLQPGQLVVIGARPAVGKSTLALDIARHTAIKHKHRRPAVFFSLEMDRSEIVERLFSAECRVPLHHIRAGTVTEADLGRMERRTQDIQGAPLIIDDSPNLTLAEVRSRARRIAQAHDDLALVVVDYLQLMQSGSSRRPETRQQEVSEMSRNLKLLAKELGVPVVALSQLNRGPEQRMDKRPMLADLRESGAVEQDADVVILLHREDVYEKESPRAGEADLIVAKHRNGPTGTITVAFQGHYSRFANMATG